MFEKILFWNLISNFFIEFIFTKNSERKRIYSETNIEKMKQKTFYINTKYITTRNISCLNGGEESELTADEKINF